MQIVSKNERETSTPLVFVQTSDADDDDDDFLPSPSLSVVVWAGWGGWLVGVKHPDTQVYKRHEDGTVTYSLLKSRIIITTFGDGGDRAAADSAGGGGGAATGMEKCQRAAARLRRDSERLKGYGQHGYFVAFDLLHQRKQVSRRRASRHATVTPRVVAPRDCFHHSRIGVWGASSRVCHDHCASATAYGIHRNSIM